MQISAKLAAILTWRSSMLLSDTPCMHTMSCIGFQRALTFQIFKKCVHDNLWCLILWTHQRTRKFKLDTIDFLVKSECSAALWWFCGAVCWAFDLPIPLVCGSPLSFTASLDISYYAPRPLPRCYSYVGQLEHFLHHCELFTTYYLLHHLLYPTFQTGH